MVTSHSERQDASPTYKRAFGFNPLAVFCDTTVMASWVSRGLTAYDAVYVALIEQRELALVTDDGAIVTITPGIAHRLAAGSLPVG